MGPRAAGEASRRRSSSRKREGKKLSQKREVKRENASERGEKKLFIFLNEGQN